MTKTVIISLAVVCVIGLLVFGIRHFVRPLLNSYSPPHISVTKNEITSSGGFMDPVTIEKLQIDSFGKEKRPTKYTVEYIATCSIKQEKENPPVALKEIKLNEPGRYNWTEEVVHVPIFHPDGFSARIDSNQKVGSIVKQETLDICPVKFENNNWYFINFGDPIFIGVYVYVDNTGIIHQYAAYSGKLPGQ